MSCYEFSLFEEDKYSVFILKSVEEEIEAMDDKRVQKKVLQYINRLAYRLPNNPESWKHLEGCRELELYELKPKPYRLGCLKLADNILILNLWKVQKSKSKKKSNSVKKSCDIAREVFDEFKGFIGRV